MAIPTVVYRVLAAVVVALMSLSPVHANNDGQPSGFSVVELFTSEGCSSCPPADAALADLVKETRGQRVYALAFHVDYWDSLGWADPFADKAFTRRQRDYAEALKLRSVYTPQTIVNGQREFVGSNRTMLKAAVADALASEATATLTASAKGNGEALQIEINTKDLPAGTIVHAALVESGLSSRVRRGENAGRTLLHENVVRAFRSTELSDAGHAEIDLPVSKTVRAKNALVVLYAQRAEDRRILAASEVAVPQ